MSAPRGTRASMLYFSELDDLKKPLPSSFADIIKSLIVFRNFQGLTAKSYSDASRFLWAAISNRLSTLTFSWDRVTTADFEAAEGLMKERGLSQGFTCKHLHCLNVLKDWLNENTICDGIEWAPNTSYPDRRSIRTEADRKKHKDRLPTRRAIQGLAEIYLHHAKEPSDRLLICAVGLLLVAGFRISELLSLPFDCWVKETHRGRERFGIRYWNRKTKGGAWQWSIRWLSPMGAELAGSLLGEINAITATARNQARILESDMSRVAIPNTEGREELTANEVSTFLGVTRQRLNYIRWEGLIKLTKIGSEKGRGTPNLYRKSDIEAELLKRRGKLYTFDLGNGKLQSLSDTLLIVHPGFLNLSCKTVTPLLVTHLRWGDIGQFLAGRSDARGYKRPSAFERFGITEPDNLGEGALRSPRMRSNMFRHWLNTLAHKSGMSVSQITMWMQRTNPSHTLAYLHSSSDMADLAREGIREGRLVGHYADEFNGLAKNERDGFLEIIQNAHKTSTGICTANFGIENCDLNKTCELGCMFYLRDPANKSDTENLQTKRQNLKLAIENIEGAEREGRKVVSRQRKINEKWIAAIDQLLIHEPTQ
jgi:hypothetical protein